MFWVFVRILWALKWEEDELPLQSWRVTLASYNFWSFWDFQAIFGAKISEGASFPKSYSKLELDKLSICNTNWSGKEVCCLCSLLKLLKLISIDHNFWVVSYLALKFWKIILCFIGFLMTLSTFDLELLWNFSDFSSFGYKNKNKNKKTMYLH